MALPRDELIQVLADIALGEPRHISEAFRQIMSRERDYARAQDWCTLEARRLEQERKERAL